MVDASLQNEFEFTLPKGYVDEDGGVHKEGRMRLATAADEIKPLNDPRVQNNGSYLTIILLSRVVTELGTLEEVTPEVIESLYVSDLEYLQQLYERVNNDEGEFTEVSPTDGSDTATESPQDDEPTEARTGARGDDGSGATSGATETDVEGGMGNG